MKRIGLAAALASILVAGCGDGDSASPAPTSPGVVAPAPLAGAWLRLANLSADLEGSEVRLDGSTFRERVGYPRVSRYRRVDPGSHRIRLIPPAKANIDERTVELDIELGIADGQAVTVVAAGLADTRTLALVPFEDTFTTNGGGARIRLVNAMSDFPASLELWLSPGVPVLRNVRFLEDRGYRQVTRGNFPLELRRQGTAGPLVPVVSYGLAGNATYTMFAYGTLRHGDLGALVVLDGSSGGAALER